MVKKIFEAEYAGHPVRYAFLTPGVRPYFHTWLRPVEGNTYNVTVTPERLQYARSLLAALGQTDAGAELRALENLTAQSLFPSGYSDAYVEFRTLTELPPASYYPMAAAFSTPSLSFGTAGHGYWARPAAQARPPSFSTGSVCIQRKSP